MKKVFLGFLALVSVLVLVACGPGKREQDPVFKGVKNEQSIDVGAEFDPLGGITAFENSGKKAAEITDKITHTFNADWTLSAGTYEYSISVTNSADRSLSASIKLIVGGGASALIEGPDAVTYYIGSKEFNPLEEMRGYNSQTNEAVALSVEEDDYSTAVPGKYSYVVVTDAAAGAQSKKTVTLHVKRLGANEQIPENGLVKGKQYKIEMWHSNGTAIETQLKKYALDFTTKMAKEGYNIEVTITKNGATYDELRTNVINALKGAEIPNIVQNYPDHVVEYAKTGKIVSLTPYIQHPVYGYNSEVASESFTDILESYRKEQRATNNEGDYISLPFNKSTEVVTYNKTAFDQVLMGRDFPETWQALFGYAPELIANKDAVIEQIGKRFSASGTPQTDVDAEVKKAKDRFVPFTYDSSNNAFITLTRQFGGAYTSRSAEGVGQIDFVNDQTVEMLEFFAEHRNEYFAVPKHWEVGYGNAVSKTGTTLFSAGSTGGIHYNTPVEKGFELFEVGVAPVPYDRFNKNRQSVIQQGTNVSMMDRGTAEDKLASWEFIKFLTSNSIQEEFSLATGYSPIRESVYSNTEFLKYLAQADSVMAKSYTEAGMTLAEYQKAYETKVKAMGLRVAMQQREFQFFDQPFVGSSAAREQAGVAFERVMLAPVGADIRREINDALAAAKAEAEKSIGK